jgi:hypothetical protein
MQWFVTLTAAAYNSSAPHAFRESNGMTPYGESSINKRSGDYYT